MSKWVSKLAPYLERFVDLKQNLGFTYRSQIATLLALDRFCLQNFPEQTAITLEMALAWSKPRSPDERATTANARISVLRQLALYIRLSNPDCFVPDISFRLKKEQFICHILSDQETERFFTALSQLGNRANYPHRAKTYQLFFRLLYCTGLRPGEALKLNREHVDWKKDSLNILASKGHAKRVVALDGDLAHRMKEYDKSLPVERLPFFSFDGTVRPSLDSLYRCMKTVWSKANPKSQPPRLYDFRHTFITKRILLWHERREDLQNKLPYLMSFVGHTRTEDTLYYFRVVPELCGLLATASTEDLVPDLGESA